MYSAINVILLGLLLNIELWCRSIDANDILVRTKRKELDPQTCAENFDVQRDKIIRTEESREMGAKYLNELDIGSREECLRLCCETETCDVFVFEEKIPGSCYLFNCGPPENFKCKFTRHGNFTSGVLDISRQLAELEDQVRLAKHEQDLASLRKPSLVSTINPTSYHHGPLQTVVYTTTTTASVRRCSRYQFECHTTSECIAIYNACDGIPQCTDGSDEAPELGCPGHSSTTTPSSTTTILKMPPRELMPEQEYTSKIQAYEQPQYKQERWPHALTVPLPHNEPSKIFEHKNSIVQEEKNPAHQHQYIQQYEPMQENQWQRRWPEQMLPDRQLMYKYQQPDQTLWKQPITYTSYEPQPVLQNPMQLQSIEPQIVQMEQQSLIPIMSIPDNSEKIDERSSANGAERDKMWAVPSNQPVLKQEYKPVYPVQKTMPETPIMYYNQQGTLRDSPKKGFDLMKKQVVERKPNVIPETTEEKTIPTEPPKQIFDNTEKVEITTRVELKADDNKTKKKVLNEHSVSKANKIEIVEKVSKHDVNHDHYKMVEDQHDGLSEKPPGAILLLVIGIIMTVVMAVMLGCRLRVTRRRMRRGKSYAHDADYLVNGMYL